MWLLFLSRRLQVAVAALLLLTAARVAVEAHAPAASTEVRGALVQMAPERS